MILRYQKSESGTRPDAIDSDSSKTTVYLRKNILEKQRINEQDGNQMNFYEYEESKLTKKEYEQYIKEISLADIQQQRADIDYIALMSGIDLEDGNEQAV